MGASGGRKTQPATLLRDLQTSHRQLRRLTVLKNRLDRDHARSDTRQWVQDRRARTRHLIELGGLVQKAGLVELVDDDRATMLGALLDIADQLRIGREDDDRSPQQLAAAWRRRGLRAFDADKDAAATTMGMTKEEHPDAGAAVPTE
jgi:hypothetical protein